MQCMDLKDYYYLDSIKRVTDKGWSHSYIEYYYSHKFTPLKSKPLVMLELGVHYGNSTRLWNEWFENAFIYGIDISDDSIKRIENMRMVKGIVGDGYTIDMVNKFDDEFFDIIIEDGPHTLESQIFAVNNWGKKIKKNGTLIIEDIQEIGHVNILMEHIENNLDVKFYYKVFDLRSIKNRYDDIILELIRI